MKKAMLFFALMAMAMAQAAFAQSKACLDEKNKANAMKEKCIEVNKAQGADEFNKCLEGLKAQVAKANKTCGAGNQEPAAAPAKPAPAPAKAPAASRPKPAPKASQQPPPAQAQQQPPPPAYAPAQQQPPPPGYYAPAQQQPPPGYYAPAQQQPPLAYDPAQQPPPGYYAPAQEPPPAYAPAQPQPAYAPAAVISKASSGIISEACMEEFASLPKQMSNFNLPNLFKELAPAIVKQKAMAKLPFGKPKDTEKTSIGVTVGCLKAFPESAGELQAAFLEIVPNVVEGMVKEWGVNKAKAMLEGKLQVPKEEMQSINSIEQMKYFAQSKGAEIGIIEAFDAVNDGLAVMREELGKGKNADALALVGKLSSMTDALAFLAGGKEEDGDYKEEIEPKKNNEEGIKLGVRAGFNMNQVYSDYGEGFYPDMGMGAGLGLAIKIPLTGGVSLYLEPGFYYRILYTYSILGYDDKAYEYAISAPVLIQFMPMEDTPFYLAAGLQLDVPAGTTVESTYAFIGVAESFKVNRSSCDLGLAVGLGYMATPNIGVDLKGVYGLMGLPKDFYEGAKFWQYGLGLTYLF